MFNKYKTLICKLLCKVLRGKQRMKKCVSKCCKACGAEAETSSKKVRLKNENEF